MAGRDSPAIIITGSSGLIGSSLVSALGDDYRVAGLDVKPAQTNSPGAKWYHCDMTRGQSIRSALESVRDELGSAITSVIHLAAYYDFSGQPSPLYRDLTIEGTGRLLHQLQTLEPEQFIFSSTLLVMEPSETGDPLTAESPVEAEWDYPRSKLAAERVIHEQHGDIPAVILRIAGVYDDHCRSIPIAQQISRIYEKRLESYLFPGDPTHGQAMVHLADVVECFRCAVRRRHQLGPYEVFLIGEEEVMSYEQLQETLGELMHGEQWPTIRIPKPLAKAGAWAKEKLASSEQDAPFIKPWMIDLADQHYPVAIGEARSRLGWKPAHSLRATLPAMVDYLKRDPRHWYQENKLPLPDHLATEQQNQQRAGASK